MFDYGIQAAQTNFKSDSLQTRTRLRYENYTNIDASEGIRICQYIKLFKSMTKL